VLTVSSTCRLTKFLVEEKGFSAERVARGIEKLKKALGERRPLMRWIVAFSHAVPSRVGTIVAFSVAVEFAVVTVFVMAL
jgi:hypothetical protein